MLRNLGSGAEIVQNSSLKIGVGQAHASYSWGGVAWGVSGESEQKVRPGNIELIVCHVYC